MDMAYRRLFCVVSALPETQGCSKQSRNDRAPNPRRDDAPEDDRHLPWIARPRAARRFRGEQTNEIADRQQ